MTIDALRTPDAHFENLPDWPYAPNYIDDCRGMKVYALTMWTKALKMQNKPSSVCTANQAGATFTGI
ncbi:MAG: hypothetical protein JKY34_10205 [Kordiimonadaceae bacterium]|nr:hypothetical protein [Kordiimonadaceae bacterium]